MIYTTFAAKNLVLLLHFALPRIESCIEFYDLVAVLGKLLSGGFASSA